MKKIFTSIMAMACAMTMSAQTTVTATEPVTISTAFTHDIIHESNLVDDVEIVPKFGEGEEIYTDDHACMYVAQKVVGQTINGSGNCIPDEYDGAAFTTTSGHTYKFQPFNQPNAIMIITGKATMQRHDPWTAVKVGAGETTKKIEFSTSVSASKYNKIGLLIDVMGGPDTREVEITLHGASGDTKVTKKLSNWCKQKPTGADVDPVINMDRRWWERSSLRSESGVFIHELALDITDDISGVTIDLPGDIEINDGGFWGYHTVAILGASAWKEEAPAEITSVSFNGGKAGDWKGYSKQVSLELNEGKYTGELDLSDFTGNFEFKLVVNGGGDDSDGWGGWIGTNNLKVDAPENWVVSTGDSDNANCLLNNATTGYQTYTITATWEANPVYYKNWTVKIEGKDERTNAPENGYYLVGTMTDWALKADYIMTKNEGAAVEEYTITKDLDAEAQFKVVKYEDGTQTWYPDGTGNNYGENGEMQGAGTYTIYFRPNGDGGDGWFNGVIYAVNTTGINNIAAETLKTAVIYNINGQRVSQPSRGLYIMNGKKVVLK